MLIQTAAPPQKPNNPYTVCYELTFSDSPPASETPLPDSTISIQYTPNGAILDADSLWQNIERVRLAKSNEWSMADLIDQIAADCAYCTGVPVTV